MSIKVLIVDDSVLVRSVLKAKLGEETGIEIMTAEDPYAAREIIVRNKPDCMTLDLNMPKMDGLTFLKKIMTHLPIPTIIVSSLCQKGSDMAMEALRLGAIDVVAKPNHQILTEDIIKDLVRIIRITVQVKALPKLAPATVQYLYHKLPSGSPKAVVIGSSTGGPQALEKILSELPPTFPGIAIAQHMPPLFTQALAKRLDAKCAMHVREAKNGDTLSNGQVLIAPGDRHMTIRKVENSIKVLVKDGPKVNQHRPSIDILFHSSVSLKQNVIGVILTGMSGDGAKGLLKMKDAGAWTIAEHQSSCVVYGMSKDAINIGAAQQVKRLEQIGPAMIHYLSETLN